MSGENAYVLRQTQLGIENTAGTAVAANVLLQSIGLRAKPVVPSEMLQGNSGRANVAEALTKGEHTQAGIEGFPAFNDLCYLFSLAHKSATISTPAGATLARDWTFLLKMRGAQNPKTSTVEVGIPGVDTLRFSYGNITSYEIEFPNKGMSKLSGTMIGRRLAEEGVTATTASITTIPVIPVTPALIDYYAADTLAGLSSGRLTDTYSSKFSIGDIRQPVFPHRTDQQSFAGLTDLQAPLKVHIEMEHNSQSTQHMRQLRKTMTRFFRAKAYGEEIEPGYSHELEITLPYKVMNPDRGDLDKVYGGMYDLESVDFADLGGTGQSGFALIRVRSSLASLIAATDLAGGQQPDTLVPPTTGSIGGA